MRERGPDPSCVARKPVQMAVFVVLPDLNVKSSWRVRLDDSDLVARVRIDLRQVLGNCENA